MSRKILIHSAILTISVIIIFFFVTDDKLPFFSLQLTGILLLTLLISHKILKPESFKLAESTVSTMAVLLVCTSTGGLISPLFFLNYLILFELSVLLEPFIPLLLSVCFGIFYFLTSSPEINTLNYVQLAAFPMMTPLAIILGDLYLKTKNQKKEIKVLSERIKNLKDELVAAEIKK
jgi:hypothetical protein